MDDDELRRFIGQVREDISNIGESLVIGRLHSMGYHVPGNRVRRATRGTDPNQHSTKVVGSHHYSDRILFLLQNHCG